MLKAFKNKKAVSPLIATILLIAFAVALGAVVMSWGMNVKPLIEKPGIEKCSDVSLEVQKIKDIPQAFYGGSGPGGLIKFTIANTGSYDVNGIILWIVGEKDTYIIDLKKSSIKVGYPLIKETQYNFDMYGEVKKLKFIPKIKIDDLVVTCAKSSLEEERISPVS